MPQTDRTVYDPCRAAEAVETGHTGDWVLKSRYADGKGNYGAERVEA